MVTKIKEMDDVLQRPDAKKKESSRSDMNILYKKKRGRPSLKPDGKKLLNEYKDMTALQLSIRYCVSEGTIKRWIREIRCELKKEERV